MTTFNFSTKAKTEDFDWKRELTRFDEAREADAHVVVDLRTKHLADMEIRRRVTEMHFRRDDASYAGAWAEFIERAKVQGTEEASLLTISQRGVLTMTKNPTVQS